MIDLPQCSLGMELGSTRIKAVLIDAAHTPLAQGEFTWENRLQDGIWTYPLEEVRQGVQAAYAALAAFSKRRALPSGIWQRQRGCLSPVWKPPARAVPTAWHCWPRTACTAGTAKPWQTTCRPACLRGLPERPSPPPLPTRPALPPFWRSIKRRCRRSAP